MKTLLNKLGILKTASAVAAIVATTLGTTCHADNPIIQTKYTADPAPMVYSNTVYLYTSHDEDDATGFKMFNWMLYTSTDMVNWTDHGIIGGVKEPYKTFSWGASTTLEKSALNFSNLTCPSQPPDVAM